jgi:histidine triad (HIT) family protein
LAYDDSCIFCRIVAKQAPSSVLYEDDVVMAFMDIRPLSMGHALVIPKAHYADIFDIPAKELAAVHIASKVVAAAVKKATGADGISIIEQNGKAAGQDVFHLHVHVVPRFAGVKLPAFNDLKMVERSLLDAMAERIRQYL